MLFNISEFYFSMNIHKKKSDIFSGLTGDSEKEYVGTITENLCWYIRSFKSTFWEGKINFSGKTNNPSKIRTYLYFTQTKLQIRNAQNDRRG